MSEPTNKDVQDFSDATTDPPSKLDAMAITQGLARKPEETDGQLGQRILEAANRTGPLISKASDPDKESSTLLSEVVYPEDRTIYAVFKRSIALHGSVELLATATTESIAEVIRSHVSDGETFIKPIKLYGDHRTTISGESEI